MGPPCSTRSTAPPRSSRWPGGWSALMRAARLYKKFPDKEVLEYVPSQHVHNLLRRLPGGYIQSFTNDGAGRGFRTVQGQANGKERIVCRELLGRQVWIERICANIRTRQKKAMHFFPCGEIDRHPHGAPLHGLLDVRVVDARGAVKRS